LVVELRTLSRSWRWFAQPPAGSRDDQFVPAPDDRALDKLVVVLDHLPPGPFTRESFLAHAIGLNAIANATDIDLILDHLAGLGLIYRFGANVDTWAVLRSGATVVPADPGPQADKQAQEVGRAR
jgi:hypothetical protein